MTTKTETHGGGVDAQIVKRVQQYDTPKMDDHRRRYTPAQLEMAVKLALSTTPAPSASGGLEAVREALVDMEAYCTGGYDDGRPPPRRDVAIAKARAAIATSAATRGERECEECSGTGHTGIDGDEVYDAQDRISVLLDKIEAEVRGDIRSAQMNGSFRGESVACGKLGIVDRIRASLDLATDAEG